MSQMKEQNKTPENKLNKIQTNNQLDAEFKTLVIRMLNELSEDLNSIKKKKKKKKKTIKKNQSEIKQTLTDMKNIYRDSIVE